MHKYCPFIASMAVSLASKLAKLTKANPLEPPLSTSRIIWGEREEGERERERGGREGEKGEETLYT